MNERDLAKTELAELHVKYTTLVTSNERLKDQLRLLEHESFEIQARLRRGIEVERENENITKSVEAQRERDLQKARTIEELRGIIRAKDLEIERISGKTEVIGGQSRLVEQELGDAKAEVQRLLEVVNRCKTQEVIAEQRKNQFEIEIIDLKRQIQT